MHHPAPNDHTYLIDTAGLHNPQSETAPRSKSSQVASIRNPKFSITGSGDTRFKYTGHERDDESALDYMLARLYENETGRFMQIDPLAEKYPHLSPYVYTAGNPLKFVDPDGKRFENSGIAVNNNQPVVLSNQTLIYRLWLFDTYVSEFSGLETTTYSLMLSGGDRYRMNGRIYSATTNEDDINSPASQYSKHLRPEVIESLIVGALFKQCR